MAMTVGELKERKRDYFLARSQDDELVMEPFCYCGKTLEQEYFCADCNHKCHVTLIVCDDPGALALAQKLLAGSPDFHKFEVETLAR